jgi:hypothetical protein
MPGFGFQRSCCLYYPMGFLVYVMRWWRVRFWPTAACREGLKSAKNGLRKWPLTGKSRPSREVDCKCH